MCSRLKAPILGPPQLVGSYKLSYHPQSGMAIGTPTVTAELADHAFLEEWLNEFPTLTAIYREPHYAPIAYWVDEENVHRTLLASQLPTLSDFAAMQEFPHMLIAVGFMVALLPQQ